MVPLSSPLAP
jgi:hypothetical protein